MAIIQQLAAVQPAVTGDQAGGQCTVLPEWLFITSINDVQELQGDIPIPLYFHTKTVKYVFV